MIYRIIGRSGSGKTSYLLEAVKDAHESGKESIILTPEQQSIDTENALSSLLGSGYNLTTEILNFERLPDRVFREHGGVTLSRADSKTLSLFTAIACENAKEKLTVYENSALDKDFSKRASSSINRMENVGVSPAKLVSVASLIDAENSVFREKLYDMGEIYFEYTNLLNKGYADSAGVQKKLHEKLLEKNFFEGKTVFIDGYYNFTPAELPIVEMIFKGADDVYITVLYDKNDKSGIFDVNFDTLALTERMGKGVMDIYPTSPRARTNELSFLEKNLFSDRTETFSEKCENVSVYSCQNAFEESEFVSKEIIKLINKGYRYKDIFIATRDENQFDGILDTALNRYGIPFYSADKEELSSKELPSLVLSLLEIAYTDWSLPSVLKYINSTFSPLTSKEADLLSIYAEVWRIRGKRWYDGEEWLMNPSGYKTNLSGREKDMLSTVNQAREKLLFALEAQVSELKSRNLTVAKGVRAIYNHLIHIKADEALEKRAISLLEEGFADEKSKISALWDSIMSILNTLYETAGDRKATPKRLLDLIRLMMDEYKVGSIPAYSDSVEIGNASIMRPSSCKVMFVLGMNDGTFPASPESSGLFSDREKEFLKSAGINSEVLPDEFIKNEFLIFYNLCAAPTDKLYLTYSKSSLSGGVKRPSMFIDAVTKLFDCNLEQKYKSKKTKPSTNNFSLCKFDTFSEEVLIPPVSPDFLYLSASKIEQYLKCPFSYYCKYILSLEKYDKAVLTPLDAGTYVHKIVELFTKSLFETGEFKGKTEDEIKEFFSSAKEKYADNVFHGKISEREKYSFNKHEALILPLLQNINDEFASGGFMPKAFEQKIENQYSITDKTHAKISGYADRIDVLEKDGVKYVRIVDYKTGKMSITPADVKEGFKMQMPLYLFSHLEKDERPGGFMYFLCGLPSGNDLPFQRKGMMLNDENIKEGIKFLTDNKHFSNKSFYAEDIFEEMKTDVEENIRKVGKDIIDGKMNISPNAKKDPCKYCNARLYCRKKLEKGAN